VYLSLSRPNRPAKTHANFYILCGKPWSYSPSNKGFHVLRDTRSPLVICVPKKVLCSLTRIPRPFRKDHSLSPYDHNTSLRQRFTSQDE
jgi:hypothetical protein